MGYPKIVYDPGTGPVTLAFTYPPVKRPGADPRQAVRFDSIAGDGQRQSWAERVDRFRELQMDYVPFADLPAWEAFIDWALLGGVFKYYPDATVNVFEDWVLEDDGWDPAQALRNFGKFKLRMRKAVSA